MKGQYSNIECQGVYWLSIGFSGIGCYEFGSETLLLLLLLLFIYFNCKCLFTRWQWYIMSHNTQIHISHKITHHNTQRYTTNDGHIKHN
jgi:hypothetical protein